MMEKKRSVVFYIKFFASALLLTLSLLYLYNRLFAWEVYKNEELGFQIRHPKNWYIIDTGHPNVVEVFNKPWGYSSPVQKDESDFGVTVWDNPDFSTIEEYKKSIWGIPPETKIIPMQIGGRKIRVLIFPANGFDTEEIRLLKNGKIYRILYTSGSSEQFKKDYKIFKRILSTFRFISQTPAPK